MARKLPPYRFKKHSYAKDHPGKCKRISTPSGSRWLCKTGPTAKKTKKKAKKGRKRC